MHRLDQHDAVECCHHTHTHFKNHRCVTAIFVINMRKSKHIGLLTCRFRPSSLSPFLFSFFSPFAHSSFIPCVHHAHSFALYVSSLFCTSGSIQFKLKFYTCGLRYNKITIISLSIECLTMCTLSCAKMAVQYRKEMFQF